MKLATHIVNLVLCGVFGALVFAVAVPIGLFIPGALVAILCLLGEACTLSEFLALYIQFTVSFGLVIGFCYGAIIGGSSD